MRRGQRRSTAPDPGRSAAASYVLLLPQIARQRAVLAADVTGSRPIAEVRREHAELDHLLASAVAQAFIADALDAPTPDGMSSWVAEGLARSQERELALFAAADINGILQATTAPGPRWGNTDIGKVAAP